MRRTVLSLQRRYAIAALVLAGCAVYDVPSDPVDADGAGGNAGTSAGSAPVSSGKDSAGSAAQPIAGSSTAGSAATTSGAGGSQPLEPPAGGEGGAPLEPDACPDDPDKLMPGACGCGLPDENTAALADCRGIEAALVHRYDFEGTGTAVTFTWRAAGGEADR